MKMKKKLWLTKIIGKNVLNKIHSFGLDQLFFSQTMI